MIDFVLGTTDTPPDPLFLAGGPTAASVATGADVPEWISVRAVGGVGDGVTNDSAAIQAAQDTIPTGGVVYFPRGTWLHSGIAISTTGMTFLLDPGATIKLADASDISAFTVTAASFTLEGGQLDGNSTGQSTGITSHGVLNTGDRCNVRDCYIHSFRNTGVRINRGDNCRVERNRMTDIIQTGIVTSATTDIFGLYVVENDLDFAALGTGQLNGGIKIQADTTGGFQVEAPIISNNRITLAQSTSMPANAVCIETLYNVPRAVITGNTVEGGSIGITVGDSQSGNMSGNTVIGPWNIGLEVAGQVAESDYAVLTGNTVDGGTVETNDGITISGGSIGMSVSGNAIQGVGVDGIKVQTAPNCSVYGNSVQVSTDALRGIRMIESTGFVVAGNNLRRVSTGAASPVGILLDSCGSGVVSSNTVSKFKNGIRGTDATSTSAFSPDNILIVNNNFDVGGAVVTEGFSTGEFWGPNVHFFHNRGIEHYGTAFPSTARILYSEGWPFFRTDQNIQYVRSDQDWLGIGPSTMLRNEIASFLKSGNQATTAGTNWQAVGSWSELKRDTGTWNGTNGEFTVNKAGWYDISYNATMELLANNSTDNTEQSHFQVRFESRPTSTGGWSDIAGTLQQESAGISTTGDGFASVATRKFEDFSTGNQIRMTIRNTDADFTHTLQALSCTMCLEWLKSTT